MEEDISRKIGVVMTERGSPYLTNTDSDSGSVDQIYDIGAMTSQMIGSVKVALILSINASETKVTVQDVPQTNTLQSRGSHSTVSPEEMSEQWHIWLKQAREKILQNYTMTHSLICNASSEAIHGRHSVTEQ